MIKHLPHEDKFFKDYTDDDLLVYLNDYHKDVMGFRMDYKELVSMRGNRKEIFENIEALELYPAAE